MQDDWRGRHSLKGSRLAKWAWIIPHYGSRVSQGKPKGRKEVYPPITYSFLVKALWSGLTADTVEVLIERQRGCSVSTNSRQNQLAFFKYVYYICLFASCMCVCVPQSTCGSQRRTCKSQFSASTLWISAIKLKSQGLAARSFTCGTLSLSHNHIFVCTSVTQVESTLWQYSEQKGRH